MKSKKKVVHTKEKRTITVNGQKVTDMILTIEYPNGDIYEGQCDEGNCPNGRGIMKYKRGDVYEGEWKKGQHSGKGKMKYRSGDVYEGFFQNSYRERLGVHTFANGCKIEAMWNIDKLQPGEVTFVDKNGTQYKGALAINPQAQQSREGWLIDNNSGNKYWLKFTEVGGILEFKRTNSQGDKLGEGSRHENKALVGKIYKENGNVFRNTEAIKVFTKNIAEKMSKKEDGQQNAKVSTSAFFNELLYNNLPYKKFCNLFKYVSLKEKTNDQSPAK